MFIISSTPSRAEGVFVCCPSTATLVFLEGNMAVEVQCGGVVGEYYTADTGNEYAERWPEESGDIAWLQVSPTTRRKLRAQRTGHATCVWVEAH